MPEALFGGAKTARRLGMDEPGAAMPMAHREIARALTVLRVARGWNQDELARASEVRPSAISDYERGRKMPELETLRRLLAAMGYPLAAIDFTRAFIESLTSGSALAPFRGSPIVPGPAVGAPGTRALSFEIDQVAAECGRAATRFVRIALTLLVGRTREGTTAEGEP
jgi:transcriptional regulator with XRE-family HTH domain